MASDFDEAKELVTAIEDFASQCSVLYAAFENLHAAPSYAPLAAACPIKCKGGDGQDAILVLMQEALVWAEQCREAIGLPPRDFYIVWADLDAMPKSAVVSVKPSGDFEPDESPY